MLPIDTESIPREDLTRITAVIVTAYLRGNRLSGPEIPEAIQTVFSSLTGIVTTSRKQSSLKPAVPIKKSVLPDGIICLEDGRKLKMLKRYLRTRYDLTPDQYRKKWGLANDYPMVAPNYANDRSAFAKKMGLGRKAKKKT